MTNANAKESNLLSIGQLGLLAAAFILLVLAGGGFSVPVAAWIGPALMVRFVRSHSLKSGLALCYAVLVGTTAISWHGMIPIPFLWALISVYVAMGLVFLLPYLIDRLLVGQVTGFLSTLVLPVAWVTVDFVDTALNPYGDWPLLAYSQHGNLPLLQLLSVTGVWGVTFVVVWFASIANWAWEEGFSWDRIRTGVTVYASIFAAILLFGGVRMAVFPSDAPTVRVASVSAPMTRTSISDGSGADKTDEAHNKEMTHNELFRLSEIGVRSGAKIILWSEANAQVDKADEDALIERGRTFARLHGVYLSMALFVKIPDQHLRENKTVTLDPEGEVVSTYFKSRPPIGEPSVIGDGIIPVIETPWGTISSVICSDMDSPFHLRGQSLAAGIDIMLAPAWDWEEIDPYHTYHSSFRAIENGFSMVRQANDGLSMATDYQGNVLAAVDHFTTDEAIMISQVPMKGQRTMYARIGDTFAWVCLIALLAIATRAIVRKAVSRKETA